MIPDHLVQSNRTLDAYVRDNLKEEVFDEGQTRNIPAFTRFFDAQLEPFKRRQSRNAIVKAPRFCLFDVGIAGETTKAKPTQFSRALWLSRESRG